MPKHRAEWIFAALSLLMLVLTAGAAWAAPCDYRVSPDFIEHDLAASYCELCGYGYVTVTIGNPYEEADMVDMTLVEDLRGTGLTFATDPSIPDQVTYRVNGGPQQAGGAPGVSGLSDQVLTWSETEIPDLARLRFDDTWPYTIRTISITFAVTRAVTVTGITHEGLASVPDRRIRASLTYDTQYEILAPPLPPTYASCPGSPATVSTGLDSLPLNEPDPDVYKWGRNMDAGQGNWTPTVYGHDNDDVIWRIQVANNGSADLQDLRLDDVMQGGSMQVNFACPTYAEAAGITANNGADPGGNNCVAVVGNTIEDFDVDDPFGDIVAGDTSDFIDVEQGGSAEIYLVGKIEPDGSCDAGGPRTNTVEDVQWGCQSDTPPAGPGGISQTSTGSSPGSDTATLYTYFSDRSGTLSVARALTGVNTAQPVGSRGTMTIVIQNNTGGSVKDITLADVLPADYVMDPTYAPTATMDPRYGTYAGMIDTIAWTNQDVGNPLNNTAPTFTLTSSTVHPFHADQRDMMRDGDELTIVFRVVMIEPDFYDKTADLDVREENVSDGTDPDNRTTLTNQLTVEFDTFCAGQGHQTLNFNDTNIPAFPEDLDIDMAGDLIYILTGDPNQRLPLTVNLTNNGGHDAEDFTAFVSFGVTMDVVTVPAGCTPTSNPPPLEVWREPALIPASAAVYACTGGLIGPGQTRALDFEVIKKDVVAYPLDVAADDLTFRADVVGQINLSDGSPLTFPVINVPARTDGGTDVANNYSLDGIRARVIGFNLLKSQLVNCSENNNPLLPLPDRQVQIGEECTYHIDTGGWFGFLTPGFTLIAVQDITVFDQLPNGQGYIRSTPDPTTTSTGAIQGITLNPPPVAPNEVAAPDYLNWTFNQGDALRIEEKDHWFRTDITARLLNDPIDVSAAPNLHAAASTNVLVSTFQAVFESDITGDTVTYLLGPGTVGYPSLAVRQFALTVTEPEITVVKEVCNETLYGAGPTCSNFVALADDGDAYDSYIYRLTLTNEAASGGVNRAPAYDVTVTDTLDAADLAYVLPFGTDGLNNDGDAPTDEAGANSEGTISDNVVDNSTPARITFSYTHSTALQRIDPGAANAVRLYYRVDFDDDAAPLQTFTNTAAAAYDTLEGGIVDDFSNQTVVQRPNSDIAGARVYTSAPDTAAVRILPLQTQPKEIVTLSNTPLAGAGTQGVSIGEEIEYRLTTSLPVAQLREFVIQDNLPAGLSCSEARPIDLNQPPYAAAGFERPDGSTIPLINPDCLGNQVTWEFGDVVLTQRPAGDSYFSFPVTFIARVENSAGTNDGNTISNGDPATVATARYIDEAANPVVLNFGQVDVAVHEPAIALTKAFAVASADAADILTVTVTAENTGTAPAYNLRVLDNLVGRNLTYIGNVGGSLPPDNIDTTTLGANQPIFGWNPPNGIAAGATISFTFQVRVDDVVQPQEILDNTIQADWTSLPGQTTALNSTGSIGADGSAGGMRVGALPNAGDTVNDYETSTGDQVAVPVPTLAKTDLAPAVIPAIGERKTFRIDITLPEGVTNGVIATDNLAATGLSYILENNATYDITYTFQGIDTINGLTPVEAAMSAFPADGDSGSVAWEIGTVVTRTENDPTQNAIDPLIRIQYYARINNDMVTDNDDALQNGAFANYTHGETGAQETLSDNTPAVTVVEPLLGATKTWRNVTAGKLDTDPPEGGDLLEYAVVILNSGTATAYDVNVMDTLPATLSLYAGFTPTALINSVAVAGFVATPANAPAGPLVWGRGNGDNSLDIPSGQSLVLTYRTVVTAAGGDISNSVMADWTSLDGASTDERTGQGCPGWTAPNDYCTGPAVATVTTVDNNSIEKRISADTFDTVPWSTAVDAVARVGDIITYRLAINLSGGLTRSLQVQDLLPGGMVFVETAQINGDTTDAFTAPTSGAGSNFSYAPITGTHAPAAGQTGTLTWTIGDIVNDPFGDATTDTLEILYLARIQPDAGIAHVASATLTNTVNMDYATASGPATTRTDNASVTVVQPVLAVNKSALSAGGDAVLAADEIVTYTVDIVNSGGAPAYDTLLTDIIPVGMRNGTATITTTSIQLLSGAVLPNLAPAYDAAAGLAAWDFDTGAADQYAIPAGDTLRIVYQVQADTTLSAGMTLTNQAQVQHYYSLDDEDMPSEGGATGEAQIYGPSNIATVTFTTDAPDALIKDNPTEPTAAIGELFSYRITVPATPQITALHDVRILDDLSASAADLSFIGVTKISGSQPWTPVNTGTATNLVIEDATIGIDIPAGEQIVIDITVVLDNTATNVSGLLFNNTADYTFDQISDDPTTRTPGGADTTGDMTIVGADALTLEKSGPAVVQLATPATYTLDVHNIGSGTMWNPDITDLVPNAPTGGLCAAGPRNVTAQIFLADGTTAVSPLLVEGTDFTVAFNGDPTCEWRFSLLSPAGGVPAGHRLIVNYDLDLDPDTENGTALTNFAGVTSWYSADPDAPGATPRVYTRVLTDGTPGTLDHQDAHTVTAEAPTLLFEMSVQNTTTGQNPGSNASPGDTLLYTIAITNSGPVGLADFSIVDDLDALNGTPLFSAGTLNLITVPTGAVVSATDAAGGANGTGLVNIGSLAIGAQGDPGDTVAITFEVTLAPVITSGAVVLNQAEIVSPNPNAILSDDPNVVGDTDPTETLIASSPLFQVHKISTDMTGDPAVLRAGDTLRYTITIKNIGDEDAVNVRLQDFTPARTTYVANSTRLNGNPVPDAGAGLNPLAAGILINAPENTTAGYLRADAAPAANNTATVAFDVVVDPAARDGLIIENQGVVSGDGTGSGPRADQPSDDPDTPVPDDPTRDVVGSLPLLYALKTVELSVDNGTVGIVDPNDVLRYTIVISNSGAITATGVVLTDAVPNDTAYVADSLRLNGAFLGPDGGVSPLIAGLTIRSSDNPGPGIISAGQAATITFEAQVDSLATTGREISNQGHLTSNELPEILTDSDGLPSNGYQPTITVVGDVQRLTITKTVSVVASGPALPGGELEYVVRATNVGSLPAINVVLTDNLGPPLDALVTYVAASGTLNGAAAGVTYAGSVLTADYAAAYGDLPAGASAELRFRVRINDTVAIGTPITNTGVVSWNSPVETAATTVDITVGSTPGSDRPNGIVYDSVRRTPIVGARLTMLNAGTGVDLPAACFGDPNQQGQVTGTYGFYRFDLNFSQAECQPNTAYLIAVTPPGTGYNAGPSRIIPPTSDDTTPPYDVTTCPADAIPATLGTCEAIASPAIPPVSVLPDTPGTIYYLHLLLSDGTDPNQSQIFNNHIPIDPEMDEAVAVTKTSSEINVTRGTLVPYTISVTNVFAGPMYDLNIIDRFPAGFKYVAGSARLNGASNEPAINGLQLTWSGFNLQVNEKVVIKMLLVVGSGVSEGEFTNRAWVFSNTLGSAISGEAAATVQVVPDPDFDCTDVIGKVIDDRNLNGYQDHDETGLPGVRVVTARGLTATTDQHGRFHFTCAVVPDEDRGSNFILKLDERSLPSGYRMTTENPRVQRATRGKMLRFNFGATIHRVVRIDISDGVFEPGTSDLRLQWASKIDQLLVELNKAPSVLRLAYLADVEREGLIKRRLKALKKSISKRWKASDSGYPLAIETEVFWRRGAPVHQ